MTPLSCMQPSEESYSCSNCGRGMGEFSAERSLEQFGVVMCGKCLHEMAEARREEEEKAVLEIQ